MPEYGWSSATATGIAVHLGPRILDLLAKRGLGPNKGLRVLDVGCGNGYVGGMLAHHGYDVTGVDASQEGIQVSGEAYPDARWVCLEVSENLVELLGGEPFDVVISTEVIEHIYEPRVWAQACYEALRPGGVVVCSTPYHGYLKNLMIALQGTWDRHANPLWEGGHIKIWSVRTLGRLLERGGFESMEWSGVGRVPYLWKSMLMHARRPTDTGS